MNDLEKGDIILCVISNDIGKARPAIIVQKTDFINHRDTLVVCPLTSNIIHQSIIRLTIQPDNQTNIDKESQVMVDKICAINKKRIKSVIGKISQTQVEALNASLKLWLDIF